MSTNTLAPPGTSLRSLINGFVLTKQTEGKSPDTVEYYSSNLKRFLWYTDKNSWTDDVRLITECHLKAFLGYVAGEKRRWGIEGNGSENAHRQVSYSTVRHYYVVLSTYYSWAMREGYITTNPMSKIHVSKVQPKVITPYTIEEVKRMLEVCDHDIGHGAEFLGSRNRAIILVLLDTGVRLSELVGMNLTDVEHEKGYIKVTGKRRKERVVRIGKTARKAVWRYLMYRPQNQYQELWLTEEGKPLHDVGIQSFIKRLKQRAGITSEGSTHRFRHTFAKNFLRADRKVFNLQYLLGHSDLDMVRRYTSALGMEDALGAHEKASPADLFIDR